MTVLCFASRSIRRPMTPMAGAVRKKGDATTFAGWAAAISVAALIGAPNAATAGLIINANGNAGGVQATNEPPVDGSPGFPCGSCTANPVTTFGYTNASSSGGAAQLTAQTAGTYKFTFEGAGNAANTNTFTIGSNTFTWVGSNPPASTPDGTSFFVTLTANQVIPFTLASSGGCTATNGTLSTAAGCDYLIALNNSPTSPGATSPAQTAAWIGFSDGGSPTDADFQDMAVLVSAVPEPASLTLLGSALLGLAFGVRRKKSALSQRV